MNIQVVSDLHLEFGPLDLSVEEADVLVAAGDVAVGVQGVEWLLALGRPVIYVAGNHEYWGEDLGEYPQTMRDLTAGTNVHFLENEVMELGGVRFLGCTLWTDFNGNDVLIMNELGYVMNDFQYITYQGEPILGEDLLGLNLNSKFWLDGVLSKGYSGKTVVVTHHAPLMRSWYDGRQDIVQYAYCNVLDDLLERYDIDLWVHGHVHAAFDYEQNGVRVVCNPRGYVNYKPVAEFEPGKIVSL